ncbi:MAG: DNA-processing protein DprA [Thermoflexibacter sp.]
MSVTHQLALTFISGIGCSLSKQLISYCGSAEKVFQMPKSKLLRIPNIGEILADQIISQSKEALQKAEKEVLKCEKEGVSILSYLNKDYPVRLKQLEDAPTVLFYRGKADLNHSKVVSIVGTRQATNYGKKVVEDIIHTIKNFNPLVVSGLAYGIDIAAHKVSLQNSLPTVAVFACGLDFIYPPVHKSIAEQMILEGGLLTEYPLQTKPDPHQFPQRNRIIAGLADATIVVEAGTKGGALITAEIANQYNREVFAVAGNIYNKYSAGCNNLIKEHKANILTSPEDIITFMNWREGEIKTDRIVKKLTIDLDAEEQVIYDLLMKHKELHLDELGWQSQLGVSKVATVLLNMEFKNLVKALPGKKFALL